MESVASDVTIVGGGIAGLWCAKDLVDQGMQVTLVEKASQLATGATTRNEGWLHAGAYHAIGIDNEDDARNVTERTVFGHQEIFKFVPESVEHGRSFAFIKEQDLIETAISRWGRFGVQFKEVDPDSLMHEGFDLSRVSAAFETADKSINSRIVCSKLAHYITERGAKIIMNAEFRPASSKTAEVMSGDTLYNLRSDKFVVTAGVGTKNVFEDVTGKPFSMRYFKSHLLVTPRLTEDNYFYVDTWEAGVMGHGNATIVGFNKDSIEVDRPNGIVMPEKTQLIYDRLCALLPRVGAYALNSASILEVACVKPDAGDPERVLDTNARQDLNIKVFEPAENYICAIPGKMTEAPALGAAVMEYVMASTTPGVAMIPHQPRSTEERLAINLRPADRWMGEQGLLNPTPANL